MSFTDETGGRLTLNAFADNPGGNPLLDGNEKDIAVGPHDFGFIDVNGDGCMDLFMGLCTGWKVFIQDSCAPPCAADIDGDGTVGIVDFLQLLGTWGPCA